MISFADQFGELLPTGPYTTTSAAYWVGVDHSRTDVPAMAPPAGLVWDWRIGTGGQYAWRLVPAGEAQCLTQHYTAPYNPLAAMCNHKDTHSTERLPESTAKEAPQGICAVAGFDHRAPLAKARW